MPSLVRGGAGFSRRTAGRDRNGHASAVPSHGGRTAHRLPPSARFWRSRSPAQRRPVEARPRGQRSAGTAPPAACGGRPSRRPAEVRRGTDERSRSCCARRQPELARRAARVASPSTWAGSAPPFSFACVLSACSPCATSGAVRAGRGTLLPGFRSGYPRWAASLPSTLSRRLLMLRGAAALTLLWRHLPIASRAFLEPVPSGHTRLCGYGSPTSQWLGWGDLLEPNGQGTARAEHMSGCCTSWGGPSQAGPPTGLSALTVAGVPERNSDGRALSLDPDLDLSSRAGEKPGPVMRHGGQGAIVGPIGGDLRGRRSARWVRRDLGVEARRFDAAAVFRGFVLCYQLCEQLPPRRLPPSYQCQGPRGRRA